MVGEYKKESHIVAFARTVAATFTGKICFDFRMFSVLLFMSLILKNLHGVLTTEELAG